MTYDVPMCTYCGSLDWTVRKYGRVHHKAACPYRSDAWSQARPLPRPVPVAGGSPGMTRRAVGETGWKIEVGPSGFYLQHPILAEGEQMIGAGVYIDLGEIQKILAEGSVFWSPWWKAKLGEELK